MKIYFIILHFQSIKVTKECVESIKANVKDCQTYIIIVDNGSPNKSGMVLFNDYENDDSVDVILNTKNLGYAKGLNVGISYVRENYNSDFIVLLNNDTEIKGTNWCNVIKSKYKEYNFDILGPDIISLDNEVHFNPVKRQVRGLIGLHNLILYKKISKISYMFYLGVFYIQFKDVLKKAIRYKVRYPIHIECDCEDVQLQGSCLILSNKFFLKHKGLYTETFLYFEEAILRYIADRDSLKLVYSPEIVLLHKESISTDYDYSSLRNKKLNYLRHSTKSCLLLKNMMLQDSMTDKIYTK